MFELKNEIQRLKHKLSTNNVSVHKQRINHLEDQLNKKNPNSISQLLKAVNHGDNTKQNEN